MAVLSYKQILQETNTNDPNSITVLILTHKALSDVSCLSEFKNLERLDLGFNALTSLEGLSSCLNLKWLSVVQNKLQSLKGIEGLKKLNVLNAGKNKLKSMDEVKSLVALRALILNENEIVSICKLDQMKELNTIVLSRNPISEIGEALIKTKALTKLSLSNCQLQSIGSSLRSCRELKELRLAHNDIKILPDELVHNSKLQNLDLGNNLITKWSDLKVLSSLTNLKNLNLQGNPIAERDSLAKKIKTLLPNLHVFNAKPADKMSRKVSERAVDTPIDFKSKLEVQKDVQMEVGKSKKHRSMDQSADTFIDNLEYLETKGLISKKQRRNETVKEEVGDQIATVIAKNSRKKKLKKLHNENNISQDVVTAEMDPDVQMEIKPKKQKTDKKLKHKAVDIKGNSTIGNKEDDRKSIGKLKQRESDVLDDGEIPFTRLFSDVAEMAIDNVTEKTSDKFSPAIDVTSGVVTVSTKRERKKNQGSAADALQVSAEAEVGLGGPSTWDD